MCSDEMSAETKSPLAFSQPSLFSLPAPVFYLSFSNIAVLSKCSFPEVACAVLWVPPAHMKGTPVLKAPWACPGIKPALEHPAHSAGRMEQKLFFCRDFSLIRSETEGNGKKMS